MTFPNARDCEHGNQRGKCPHCDLSMAEEENRLLRGLLREWHGMFVHCRREGTEGADLIDRTGAMLMLGDVMGSNAKSEGADAALSRTLPLD